MGKDEKRCERKRLGGGKGNWEIEVNEVRQGRGRK